MELLSNAGYTMKLSLFDTREPIHADEHALGKVLFDFEPGSTAFLLVVGSGSLTDITRMISSRTGVPFVSVATAASMDGYASPVAPLVIGGIKTTIPAGIRGRTQPVALLGNYVTVERSSRPFSRHQSRHRHGDYGKRVQKISGPRSEVY